MELSWTPSTDAIWSTPSITLEEEASSMYLGLNHDDISDKDGLIRFRMPPAPTDAGTATARSGHLKISINEVDAGVAHCAPHPYRCSARLMLYPDDDFLLPATVR